MNCQELKKQFDGGLDLNQTAKSHMESCEACESFVDENLQLSQMLTALPNVTAPKGFEFGVKSKIAQSKSNKKLSPTWQRLRYLVPFATAVLIFGFVFINSSLFISERELPLAKSQEPNKTIDKNGEDSFDSTEAPNIDLIADNNDDDQNQEPSIEKRDEKKLEKTQSEIAENIQNSSEKKESDKDEIITKDIKPEKGKNNIFNIDNAAKKPKVLREKNPNNNLLRRKINEGSKSFTANEILSTLGIETVNENGSLRVKSLKANSLAQKSGVKIGDIITAIDGRTLSNKPVNTRTVQGKILRVKRNNKDVIIAIRNR